MHRDCSNNLREAQVWVLHVDDLHISTIMLGAVKMEGHETPDWSSYYTDAQEVCTVSVVYFSVSDVK